MEEWEYMKNFAFDLINFSKTIRDENNIIKQRVIIILLDQATELLMKSYLIKNSIINRNQTNRMQFPSCLNKIEELNQELKKLCLDLKKEEISQIEQKIKETEVLITCGKAEEKDLTNLKSKKRELEENITF